MPYNLQAKDKKKNGLMVVVLVVLIFAIMGVLFFRYWQQSYGEVDPWLKSDLPPVKITRVQNLDQTKGELFYYLNRMLQNGRYGLWPIGRILLSQDRGNPFTAKQ